jgi:hypothetical protein
MNFNRLFLTAFLTVCLLVVASNAFAPAITSCTTFDDDANLGQTYTLGNDLNVIGNCFNIAAGITFGDSNYLIIDCNGFNIDYNSGSTAMVILSVDLNRLELQNCDINESVDKKILDVQADVNYLSILDSNVTITTGKSIYLAESILDINLNGSYFDFSGGAEMIYFDDTAFDTLTIRDFNLDHDASNIFHFIGPDALTTLNVTFESPLDLDGGRLAKFEGVSSSAITLDFGSSDFDINGDVTVFDFNDSNITTFTATGMDIDVFDSTQTDGSAPILVSIDENHGNLDINTINIGLDETTIINAGGLFKLYNVTDTAIDINFRSSDINIQGTGTVGFKLDGSDIDSLTITDINLLEVDSNVNVSVGQVGSLFKAYSAVDNTDIDNIYFEAEDTVQFQKGYLYIDLGSSDTLLDVNFMNSDFNFSSTGTGFAAVGSDITTLTLSDLNIVGHSSSEPLFSFADILSFSLTDTDFNTINISLDDTTTLDTANLFNFGGAGYTPYDDDELTINFNDSDINVKKVFAFNDVNMGTFLVHNLDLIDSNVVFHTDSNSQFELTDLNIYDNNMRFTYLFDVNTITTGTLYNNFFIDEAEDTNNILMGSTLSATTDVNLDFNIAVTAGTNILGNPYKGGNYWTDTDLNAPTQLGYAIDMNYLAIEDYNANVDVTDFVDYHPLTTVRTEDLNISSIALTISGTVVTTATTAQTFDINVGITNSGDENADANYHVYFYYDSTLISGCNDLNNADDINASDTTYVACTDTAQISTAGTYDITAVVVYSGTDSNSDNNTSSTSELTITTAAAAAATTSTSSSSSSGTSTLNSDGITYSFREGTDRLFRFGTEYHTVTLEEINEDSVVVSIASVPESFTLKEGESAKKDIDSDGTYDIVVTLVEISNSSYAKLEVGSIDEAVPTMVLPEELEPTDLLPNDSSDADDTVAPEDGSGTQAPADSTGDEEPAESASYLWLWIVIAVVVVLLVIWFFAKGKKQENSF